MRNILLIIEYDGTNYKGWQKQPDVISVQEKIEQILYKVTKEKIEIFGSGRTDAKVHALGQTANFNTNCTIPAEKIATVLNTYLPDDIAIKESKEAALRMRDLFDSVWVAAIRTPGVDPGNISIEELEDVLKNVEDPLNFYLGKL